MIPRIDLSEEIVPALGLGGFRVGVPLREYEDLLRIDWNRISYRAWGLWQVVYRFPQIYEETEEEWLRHHDAIQAWRETNSRGEWADYKAAMAPFEPPENRPAVSLWVDVRDGIIDAVSALGGYTGAFRKLRTGMTYAEALAAESEIVESVFLDETTVAGIDGLVLIFDPADPDERENELRAVLDEIRVFDPMRSTSGIKPY